MGQLDGLGGGLRAAGRHVAAELANQRLLRRKVPVERADADAGAAGHGVHLHALALPREGRPGGFEDTFAVAPRVGTHAALARLRITPRNGHPGDESSPTRARNGTRIPLEGVNLTPGK